MHLPLPLPLSLRPAGTRGAFMLVMRSCLVLAAFAAIFQSQPDKDGTVQQAFKVILKVLGGYC